jgi:hypothetical protein
MGCKPTIFKGSRRATYLRPGSIALRDLRFLAMSRALCAVFCASPNRSTRLVISRDQP